MAWEKLRKMRIYAHISRTNCISPLKYAKDEDEPDNVYIRITAYNRGPDPATLHIIPQLWFPNTWSWPIEKLTATRTPRARGIPGSAFRSADSSNEKGKRLQVQRTVEALEGRR